jgi:hypothetical protein
VNNAGDFNGDGFGDIIIGSYGASPHGPDSGVSYLVFGRAGGFSSTVNLAKLNGTDGIKINGEKARDYSGASVSGAGDINGDGYDDLIIGASGADPNGSYSGTSYVVFGFDTMILASRDGKTLTLADVDGDTVSIKTSKGVLAPQDLVIGPDGSIRTLNIAGDSRFGGANISISAKAKSGGNGLVNLDLLDATNIDLGKVTVTGQLGRILAGDGDPLKPALKSLTVGSLGTTGIILEPLLSEIDGSLVKLKVKRDVVGAAVDVLGSLGNATIGGDLIGQPDAGAILLASILERGFADPRVAGGLPFGALNAGSVGRFTVAGSVEGGSVTSGSDIGSATIRQDLHAGGVAAGGQIKNVKVLGTMNGDDPDHPAVIAALAKVGATKPADAVGIDALLVKGDVSNAQILLGFRKNPDDFSLPLLPANPDASAGKVLVKGDWSASSLVAGVFDATGDGFGRNDTTIPGDTRPDLFAKIASVVIKGTATGSAAPGDQYAITAQQIAKLSINGEKVALNKDAQDVIQLDPVNGDFSLVEV